MSTKMMYHTLKKNFICSRKATRRLSFKHCIKRLHEFKQHLIIKCRSHAGSLTKYSGVSGSCVQTLETLGGKRKWYQVGWEPGHWEELGVASGPTPGLVGRMLISLLWAPDTQLQCSLWSSFRDCCSISHGWGWCFPSWGNLKSFVGQPQSWEAEFLEM